MHNAKNMSVATELYSVLWNDEHVTEIKPPTYFYQQKKKSSYMAHQILTWIGSV